MVEVVPEWLKIAVGGVACCALPFFVAWMIWSTARSAKGVSRGLAGGSARACRELGLNVTAPGPLSGVAQGSWRGCSVRVCWSVGHQHGYDPSQQLTHVSALVSPPLHAGLRAVEGGAAGGDGLGGGGLGGGSGIAWPELERVMSVHAAQPELARARLAPCAALLRSCLGGPGRLSIDDSSVSLELPSASVERPQLEQALARVVPLAAALSGR